MRKKNIQWLSRRPRNPQGERDGIWEEVAEYSPHASAIHTTRTIPYPTIPYHAIPYHAVLHLPIP